MLKCVADSEILGLALSRLIYDLPSNRFRVVYANVTWYQLVIILRSQKMPETLMDA